MPKAVDDAQAFIIAAGITDPTQQSAIITLVTNLKAYGIWTKMKAIYPIVGGTASQHKFNLKDPRDLDAAFRLTFATGVTHSATGMISNGTSGFANTFLNPTNAFSVNDNVHLSFYSRTNVNLTQVDIGSANSFAGPYLFLQLRTVGITYYIMNINNSYATATDTDSRAFYLGNRIGTAEKGFKNGINVVSRTISALLRPNFTIYLLATNNGGSPSFYSTKQCAFASIGDGLTDTEAANFYTAVQAYQTTLGRQVGVPIVSDADAQAFLNAAVIEDVTQANAINDLVIGMKADGLWSKMKAIYPIVGGTASSHKYNLKDPRDLDAAFRLTFSSGWTHASTGMTPNGTSAFANTFLNTNTQLNANSHSFGMYSRTNNTSGSQVYGSFDNIPKFLQNNLSSGNFVSGSLSNVISYTANPTTSLLMLSRTSSTLSKAFRAGVLLGQETVAMGNLPPYNFYLGARNDVGTANFYSVHQCAFAFLGDGLTDTDAANFYTRVNTYQTVLSRNV